jgi:hypothetical protein
MATSPAFDAGSWIAANTYGGTRLTAEAIAAVANFTMMWNLFEGLACDNNANVAKFEEIASSVNDASASEEFKAQLDEFVSFWTFRYRTPQGFADRFLGLNFRRGDRREVVEEVLTGRLHSAREKTLALLVIVYRLRNNLFHGLKTIDMLNDQVANLNTASRCLAMLMTIAQSRMVRTERRAPPRMRREEGQSEI